MVGRSKFVVALRLLAVLACAAAGLLVVDGARSGATATAGPRAAAAPASAVDAALHRAAVLHRRVLVPALTTSSTRTWALPDGRLELHADARPSRVERDGRWIPIDTTLVRSGTTVVPRATTVSMQLSDGGDDQLAAVRVDGRRLALTWPRTLPRPVLAGATATYRNVLPGVDLRLTAQPDGFAESLIVRTRAAAADPALRSLRFGVGADGLSMSRSAAGGLTARAPGGGAVFDSGPASMWDAHARHRALATTRVVGHAVVVRPDLGFLTERGTQYPVTIDPDFQAGLAGWAKVFSGYPKQAYWKGGVDGTEAKVGDCYTASGDCNGIGVARSYFQFDMTSLHNNGGRVQAAEFNVDQTHAASCQGGNVNLYVSNSINSSTTWNTQPGNPSLLGSLNPGCTAGPHGYNISGFFGGGTVGTGLTLSLRAADESDQDSWRKFADNPTLIITYDRAPSPPANLTNAGQPCSTSAGVRFLNPDLQANGVRTVRLTASATDADAQNVQLAFTWYSGSTALGSARAPFASSGSTAGVTIPATQLVDGAVLHWHAQATDGTLSGAVSADCYFTIDKTPPQVAPSLSTPDYVAQLRSPTGDCAPPVSGGVGRTGTFTLAANSTTGTAAATHTDDVVSYRYGFTAPAVTIAATGLGGGAAPRLTPTNFGLQTIAVRSADRAGNLSPQAVYCIKVGPGAAAIHHWRLDGNPSLPGVPDSPGAGMTPDDGTLQGQGSTSSFGPGRDGAAVYLNGTSTSYVDTSLHGAVDTQHSFAVSAWARLDKIANYPTVVSVDGVHAAGFQLQATPTGHWSFAMNAQDVNGGGHTDRVVSASPAVAGRWTHLVGSYDAGAGQLTIYVDGRPDGTLAHSSTWSAPGVVSIGRSLENGAHADFFTGAIDDVRVFDHAVEASGDVSDESLTNARNLAVQPLQPRALYDFEEGSGPVATDASGQWNPAPVHGGATWTDPQDPGFGRHSLSLDGATGYAATGGAVVPTNVTFTVGAWVNLDALGATPATVLSEDGPNGSVFTLQYRPDGTEAHFAFQVSGTDPTGAVQYTASGGTAEPGEWTQLVAGYDAVSHQLTLYVDGALVDRVNPASSQWTPTAANGPLEIGRSVTGGTGGAYLAGAVDDVEADLGAITLSEVADAYNAPHATAATPFTGEFARWTSDNTPAHITSSTGAVPPGFVMEQPLGLPAPPGTPGTAPMYACLANGNDQFSSRDPNCEGFTYLGYVGDVYLNVNAAPGLQPLYRCSLVTSSTYHFDSLDPGCSGRTQEFVIGFVRSYASIVRFENADTGKVWSAVTGLGVPANYVAQDDASADGEQALVSLTPAAGTVPLYQCQGSAGEYLATVANCGADPMLDQRGYVWSDPPSGVTASAQLFTCPAAAGGSVVTLDPADDPDCADGSTTASLGWVVTQP